MLLRQLEEKNAMLKTAWAATGSLEKVVEQMEKETKEQKDELAELKEHYTNMLKQVMEVTEMETKRQKEFKKMKAESEAELEAAVTGAGLRKALEEIAMLKDINSRLFKENTELIKSKDYLSKQYDNTVYSYGREDVNRRLANNDKKEMTDEEWEHFSEEWGYKFDCDETVQEQLDAWAQELLEEIAEEKAAEEKKKAEEEGLEPGEIPLVTQKGCPGVWVKYKNTPDGPTESMKLSEFQEIEEEFYDEATQFADGFWGYVRKGHACLKPACPNKTRLNWCDECIKDERRSQHASYPFAAQGPTGPDVPESLKKHIERWGEINHGHNGPPAPRA